MKITIDFNTETKETDVRYRIYPEDYNDYMPIWDVMPYIHDALYDLVKQEAKKHNLR